VVNAYAPPFEAAKIRSEVQAEAAVDGGKAAVGAGNVLASARRFDCLEEAIADCTLVAGTTAIGERGLTRPVLALSEAAPRILEALEAKAAEALRTERGTKVALLFGSEKTGLTNEQLSHCQMLLTIPMFALEGARHLSMNLGQAVAVCLYELVRGGFEGARELPVTRIAEVTGDSRERLTQLLAESMATTGYARRFPANAREHIVRQLAQQLGSSEDEVTTWMGFLRQVLRSAKKDAPG
jgi:tRNA/rRNA methyltransferase